MFVGDRLRGRARSRPLLVLVAALALILAACPDDGPEDEPAEEQPEAADDDAEPDVDEDAEIRVGFVSAIDQIGLPAALDTGFYDEHGIDVSVADPFATGVDMLNALDAGEIDIAQVGAPAIGAILEGMDLVMIGNYTGSATQLGIDETMALVAAEDSDIDPEDLTTLEGTSVGVSVGSINHLYMLGMMEEAGLPEDAVEFVNVPPEEMPVGLSRGGFDAAAFWDPWPIIALNDVEGTFEVERGGGYLAFIGYIVTTRDWLEENEELARDFLAARAGADRWMRENPDEAAEVAVRWVPGTEQDVAQEAMEYNVQQLDPRWSQCNFRALDQNQNLLFDLGELDDTFDVNEHMDPEHILHVMEEYPEYFEDLDEIPEEYQMEADYEFDPDQADC
jgi:sulfonate transport system substrate-binding protein